MSRLEVNANVSPDIAAPSTIKVMGTSDRLWPRLYSVEDPNRLSDNAVRAFCCSVVTALQTGELRLADTASLDPQSHSEAPLTPGQPADFRRLDYFRMHPDWYSVALSVIEVDDIGVPESVPVECLVGRTLLERTLRPTKLNERLLTLPWIQYDAKSSQQYYQKALRFYASPVVKLLREFHEQGINRREMPIIARYDSVLTNITIGWFWVYQAAIANALADETAAIGLPAAVSFQTGMISSDHAVARHAEPLFRLHMSREECPVQLYSGKALWLNHAISLQPLSAE